LEKPMGKDIAKNHEGDSASRPDALGTDEMLKKKFEELVSEDEMAVRGDAWALREMADTGKPWEFLTGMEKVETLVVGFIKFLSIWGVLYMFIISLGIMGNAFKILGGRSSGRAFRESALITNPVSALAIGVLATVLMQSSSTTTSIVISMAASDLVTIEDACYLVMGANIGTSVTNTIVSIAHLNSPEEYRRAFTGAVFHDMFNWLTVGMFLPLEVTSGFLLELAKAAVESLGINEDEEKRKKVEFIKKITKPASGRVVSVDKKLIEKIAKAKTSEKVKELEAGTIIKKKQGHVLRDMPMTDEEAGVLLLFVSLTMLATCLLLLVKLLQSVLKGRVAVWTRYLLNLEFQHPCLKACGGLDSYILLLFGTGCTILVQSSSVFTSTLTPLVGIGLIHVEKMTSLTHGANIGTTVTGVLSALSGSNVHKGLTVALEHVFFNSLGTVVWFVVWPLRGVPLGMAKFMGETAANLAWFPLAYIVVIFFISPLLVIVLALAGQPVMFGILVPIFSVCVFLGVWMYIRRNRADLLPAGFLRSSSAPCGCRYPNFMQLWGGNHQADAVDMAAMRESEKAETRKTTSVREWPTSPMAWGLAILAFVGMTLALPTAQWRRVQYRNEITGRKEVGFGFSEVCSDDFKKDLKFVDKPAACDADLLKKCAGELASTCVADSTWANSTDAQGHEENLYMEAWEQCSKLGCRAEDWSQVCPAMEGCKGHPHHAARCMEPLASYYWWDYTKAEKEKCVGVVFAKDKSDEVRVDQHNNHFYKAPEEDDEEPEKMQQAVKFSRTGEGSSVLGLALDTCTGMLTTYESRSAGCAAGTALVKHNIELDTRVVGKTADKVREVSTVTTTDIGGCAANRVEVGDVQVLDRAAQHYIGCAKDRLQVQDQSGNILATYVPANQDGDAAAGVYNILPASFSKYQAGKGLEALAVSPSKEKVVTCMSAPIQTAETSPAVRCAVLDFEGGLARATLVAEKIVLKSDADVEYTKYANKQADVRITGASWMGDDKVMLVENALANAGNVSALVWEADFATGTDLKGMAKYNNSAALEKLAYGNTGNTPVVNAMVAFAAGDVTPVTARRLFDLETVGLGGSDITSVLVANAHTVVFARRAADTPLYMVKSPVKLAYDDEKCPGPKLEVFEGKDKPCHPIEDMCPEGDLKGDMATVAYLAIFGTLFLGVGMILVIVYSLMPWTFTKGHLASCACLFVAWVLLAAAFMTVDGMTSNKYGCYFVDESMRGGLVLLRGTLECLTRASYSWGFCIYAWGMLTLSLFATGHRCYVEISDPYVPPTEEELFPDSPAAKGV